MLAHRHLLSLPDAPESCMHGNERDARPEQAMIIIIAIMSITLQLYCTIVLHTAHCTLHCMHSTHCFARVCSLSIIQENRNNLSTN